MKKGTRLQKFLAECGVGSRRRCEEIIRNGFVEVNGRCVTEMGSRIAEGDEVRVNGRKVSPVEKRSYMVNKPKGVICVNRDERGRRYVVDLIPDGRKLGLFPVGRLDLDTTGLIIITNDGELANRVAHPRYGIRKEYRALIKGRWTGEELRKKMEGGVVLENGSTVKGIELRSAEPEKDRTLVVIRIHEGRKHVVRRIFLSIGSRVLELERTAIGALELGGLGRGSFRSMTRTDIERSITSPEEDR
ncbi:MAG: pseudouridine synthase [Thermoplasmatota archaeon]